MRPVSPVGDVTDQAFGIVVEAVHHRFEGRVPALEDMTFHARPREFLAMVGPSGCGKTTIQNIIAGLLPVQAGRVLIADQPPKAGRVDVAYMFAQDALLPWRRTIDNALFGLEVRYGRTPDMPERALAILSAVGLKGFEKAYPRQLSQGMRQRVALARTFLMPSPVLLMDEPFGALDAHTKLLLEQLLLTLWEADKRTVLFITHDLTEAIVLADRILVCTARPGRIKAEIEVELPRPRRIGELQRNEGFHRLYQRVWRDLEQELSG
jgi:NitT/TauT family transport system ATP-binding protein